MIRFLRHPLVALIVLALAACGTSAGGTDAPDATPIETSATASDAENDVEPAPADLGQLPAHIPQPCGLLTTDEAASVLGNPVEPDDDMDGFCLWSPTAAEGGLYASVTLAPLPQHACIEAHQALGASELFEYDEVALGVPGFAQYSETLAGTHVATLELCTAQVHVGVRVEAPEPDEAGHLGMAAELASPALARLEAAIGI